MRLVSLTSVPLQARAYLVSDWLSVTLRCDDSKPKSHTSVDIMTMHSQHFIFLCCDVRHKLRARDFRGKRLALLHAARRQDASMRAPLFGQSDFLRIPKLLCNHSPSSHVAFVIVGMVFAAILIVVEAVAAADQWQ